MGNTTHFIKYNQICEILTADRTANAAIFLQFRLDFWKNTNCSITFLCMIIVHDIFKISVILIINLWKYWRKTKTFFTFSKVIPVACLVFAAVLFVNKNDDLNGFDETVKTIKRGARPAVDFDKLINEEWFPQ